MCPVRELALCVDVNSQRESVYSFSLFLSASLSSHRSRLATDRPRIRIILYTDNIRKKCARTVGGAGNRRRGARARRESGEKTSEVRRERRKSRRTEEGEVHTFEVVRERVSCSSAVFTREKSLARAYVHRTQREVRSGCVECVLVKEERDRGECDRPSPHGSVV